MRGRSLLAAASAYAPASARRLVRRALRPRAQPLDRSPFGVFERDDGRQVELWATYRHAIKSRWPSYFWPVRVLGALDAKVELDAPAAELLIRLRTERTLPLPVDELAAAAVAAAAAHPSLVWHAGAVDETGVRPFAVAPSAAELQQMAEVYRVTAMRLLADLRSGGLQPSSSRVLEIGCGTGHATYAVAALGVAQAVGIDSALDDAQSAVERELVREALLDADAARRAHLERADAADLPFEDETFDAVFSFSALEHMQRVPEVLAEIRRVTRPGGLSVHVVDPWFSPQGGHSMCTLDAPWLHVLLTQGELERYLLELRPHEAQAALGFYRTGLQRPPRTLGELRRLVEEAGFDVLTWDERSDLYRNHVPLVDRCLLDECAERHPNVTPADLLTSALRIVLQRR